jgi:antitoxin component YwqK of YwqJK toxin-antitoxin module
MKHSVLLFVIIFCLPVLAQEPDPVVLHSKGKDRHGNLIDIKEEGTLLNGKRNGTWKTYHQGILYDSVAYVPATKNSLRVDDLLQTGEFPFDTTEVRNKYLANLSLKSGIYVRLYPGGQIAECGLYVPFTILYWNAGMDDGELVTSFSGGKESLKDGTWKEFYENGKLKKESYYEQGKLMRTRIYSEEGVVARENTHH